jgi:hypothetical protein
MVLTSIVYLYVAVRKDDLDFELYLFFLVGQRLHLFFNYSITVF